MLLDFYTALLLLPLFTYANVIFPAFSGVYVTQLLFPIIIVVALAIEVIVFKILNRKTKIFHVLGLVIGANVVSTILGIIITIFLPSGLIKSGKGILTSGPNFNAYVLYGFIIALILSIISENFSYRYFRAKFSIIHLYKVTIIGNILSYLAIYFLSLMFR